jgi:uncharacterized membrane protein HdeD (DUF308 family)
LIECERTFERDRPAIYQAFSRNFWLQIISGSIGITVGAFVFYRLRKTNMKFAKVIVALEMFSAVAILMWAFVDSLRNPMDRYSSHGSLISGKTAKLL